MKKNSLFYVVAVKLISEYLAIVLYCFTDARTRYILLTFDKYIEHFFICGNMVSSRASVVLLICKGDIYKRPVYDVPFHSFALKVGWVTACSFRIMAGRSLHA